MPSPTRHAYGADPDQFLELTLPGGDARAPVVVLLHGGFWRVAYGIELARPLAADLARRGRAAVAVEYRRVGRGGGWPHTLDDVAAALDALPDLPDADRLDLADVAVVGHSAGGHLAAWSAARHLLPAGAPGAAPRQRVTAAVSQAGVLDLELAAAQGMGDDAVPGLLGGPPAEHPGRYAVTSPVRLLPTGVPVLCVHPTGDVTVPPEQSERYTAAARAAGDDAQLQLVPGDHRVVIDPADPSWQVVVDWLDARSAARGAAVPWAP
ncbi:alpha/beta fold hydrolase [Modestobacter sp. I12A-02628]|uniref:Alpha/beta fold hydrolase n=1 Tax=Goekera deserti TaxID=2497753 RepID=A0A7K3WF07_9ACTN|nr:alpha/beta fold hydrolase [Goekera deserti]MPQ96745.1 alpha/beta fold hydrolase [Goekera deserti]NDI46941.1 alpha/beta fold hydrolase [Goekera deserti]NEL54509.1 alpha/beta fold hydrolase [Goekera deserti]